MGYDLVILGGGPAGEKAAAQAAYFGKKVAIVEQSHHFLGTVAEAAFMVKCLREPAMVVHSVRTNDMHGLSLDIASEVTMEKIIHHSNELGARVEQLSQQTIVDHGVATLQGNARFTSPSTIEVTREGGTKVTIEADKFLICTGAKEFIPDWFPKDNPHAYTAWNIKEMLHIPKELTIVGGGMIGCEYASIFSLLGAQVTVIHAEPQILGLLDNDISTTLAINFSKSHVNLLLEEMVEKCEFVNNTMVVRCKSGREIETGNLLVALGNKGNTDDLNLNAAGVDVDQRGFVIVNENYQTTNEKVFAAGDVVGSPTLASVAMEEGRLAVVKAFDLKYKHVISPYLPIGVYTIPEIASVGRTEKELKREGVSYIKGVCHYDKVAKGYLVGENNGFLKLLFVEDEHKLIGAQVIGHSAVELIHLAEAALMHNVGPEMFIDMCFNFPTLHELYKYAAYDAMGKF